MEIIASELTESFMEDEEEKALKLRNDILQENTHSQLMRQEKAHEENVQINAIYESKWNPLERQVQVLHNKKISNVLFLQTQIKEMLKLVAYSSIVAEGRMIREKITEVAQ